MFSCTLTTIPIIQFSEGGCATVLVQPVACMTRICQMQSVSMHRLTSVRVMPSYIPHDGSRTPASTLRKDWLATLSCIPTRLVREHDPGLDYQISPGSTSGSTSCGATFAQVQQNLTSVGVAIGLSTSPLLGIRVGDGWQRRSILVDQNCCTRTVAGTTQEISPGAWSITPQ